jgi:hypothetical protein
LKEIALIHGPVTESGRSEIDNDREVLMARFRFRRSLRFDSLEGRQMLSSVGAGPTDQQQYVLQLINEARTNPAAAAQMVSNNVTPVISATLQYYGVNLQSALQTISSATPQPPVAWNADLANAAQGQSQYMANNQIQSHTGADGSSPQQRITAAGYTNISSSAENAYAYANSPVQAMQAFLVDWGVPSDGHRINIQQPGVSPQNAYTDAGVGIVQTNPNNPSFGPLVITQDFAKSTNAQPQLVGVAYNDTSATGFYQPGEGQGGVQIDAVNLQTGQVLSTQTWASGGYELALPAGQYQIIASQNDTVFKTVNVTVSNVNIEQDFVLTNSWQGGTRESAIAAAQPAAVVVPATPQPVVTPPTPQPVVTPPTPQPAVAPPTSQPVSSQAQASTPNWTVALPNQPTPAQSAVLHMLSSSWSAWSAI